MLRHLSLFEVSECDTDIVFKTGDEKFIIIWACCASIILMISVHARKATSPHQQYRLVCFAANFAHFCIFQPCNLHHFCFAVQRCFCSPSCWLQFFLFSCYFTIRHFYAVFVLCFWAAAIAQISALSPEVSFHCNRYDLLCNCWEQHSMQTQGL